MEDEIWMIEKNNTWELHDIPKEKEIVSQKWICKIKLNQIREIQKHKGKLVVRDFIQKPSVDFYGTFSPVARLETIRILIVIAAHKKGRFFNLMFSLHF